MVHCMYSQTLCIGTKNSILEKWSVSTFAIQQTNTDEEEQQEEKEGLRHNSGEGRGRGEKKE